MNLDTTLRRINSEREITIKNHEVTVVDIRMEFWSMVTFMVKWAIASIPAVMILTVLFVGLLFLLLLGLDGETSRYITNQLP